MFGIDDIINAILAMAKGAAPLAAKQAQRQELVIKLLKQFNFEPEHPPADFSGVYQYTLVEYGGNQLGTLNTEDLRLVLQLFRQQEIKQAFREAFDGDNPTIFVNQVETHLKTKLENYQLDRNIRDRGIDIELHLTEFKDIFIQVVDRTRNPAQKEDHNLLKDIKNQLQSDRPTLSKSEFSQNLHDWFKALYDFESYNIWDSDYFEWIIQVPGRRRYDRILVRGIEGEAKINHLQALKESVEKHKTNEGWLVAPSRVADLVRKEVKDPLFCYTFDELIDEAADFSGYLDWLEAEVKRQEIDTLYVPLACTKEEIDPKTQQSLGKSRYDQSNGWIDRYINTWLNDSAKEHLSILGEFGTGKTWFVLHYAGQAVQKYRTAKQEGNKLPRLPLVVPLRDYAKAVSVESLFSEFFFRKHNVGLPNYNAFKQLNRMGKLLLIFDGFDEMAAKVERQQMINNFWQLAKVVVPGSKAILTCRTEHFPEAKEGRDLLNAELQASTSNLSRQPPQFEVLELEKLTDEQIREVLAKRKVQPETIAKIMANSELLDLARRPVMVNLILAALPEIESGKPVDLARIYLYAVSRKIDQDIKTERTFTSMADKLYFLCELAWEMLSTDQMSLNYRLFPDRIRLCFGKKVQEQKDLDHWHYDMMGQTLLIRNADGDYSPAHRSLLEFFVAYKLAAQLGILAPDFAKIAHISFPDNLRETFGKAPLTKAVLDLLLPMLNPETVKQRLLDLIVSTKGKTEAEVGYLGGNAATVLSKADPISLQNCDFSNTVILGADFTKAMLRNVNFTNANLSHSLFAKAFSSALSVAFSPNGNFLATGHITGEVCLWQVADGKQLWIYRGHESWVNSVAISPDGQTLASGSRDNTIKTWHLGSGECLKTFNGHESWVTSVAISPDGKTLASGSSDNTIKTWHLDSGECLNTFNGHKSSVNSVAISPDGQTLASGSRDNTIKTWHLGSGECLNTFNGHESRVYSVAISPDGQTLASGSRDNTIKTWHLGSGECLKTFNGHESWVTSVAISPDGKTLASGSDHNRIKIWHLDSGDCLKTFNGHESRVTSVAISPDGQTLASGSRDNRIKIWHLGSGDCLNSFNGHESWVNSVGISPDGQTLASGSRDNTIKTWHLGSGDCLNSFNGHESWVNSVAISPDGQTLASGSGDNRIKIWDLQSGECLNSFNGHESWVYSLAISPDGQTLASGSHDNTIKTWHLGSGDCLKTFNDHESWVTSVAISPDGQTLASGSGDNRIKTWHLGSGDCLKTFNGHESWVTSVAISPDGQTLASGSGDNTIKIWDLQSGECLKTFNGHESWVYSVAISPDGQILASGSGDNRIKIWDIKSGKCLKTISNKLYARSKIAGVTGLTEEQKASLIALGAVE